MVAVHNIKIRSLIIDDSAGVQCCHRRVMCAYVAQGRRLRRRIPAVWPGLQWFEEHNGMETDSTQQLAQRWIAHLDMDAFFASVELLRYPELRGLPVVVGGGRDAEPVTRPDGSREYRRLRDYVGRGVATTSTYEARALGVFSAMGLMKAAQLAPDALLLPADFTQYRKYSRLFKDAVLAIASCVEDRGIDEIY